LNKLLDLIRTFINREITDQKKAEVELRQRDCVLQGVAEAANYLLAEMNYEIAIEKALATFGAAGNSDHIYTFSKPSPSPNRGHGNEPTV
jgi:uncharacterized protein YheU (UPF0270 family)